jgi:hypothetical protein
VGVATRYGFLNLYIDKMAEEEKSSGVGWAKKIVTRT